MRYVSILRLSALTGSLAMAVSMTPSAFAASPAPAASGAVVAEVYGGGGNSGARLRNDFVELANPGDQAIDLAGWSVQYLAADPKPTSQWQSTDLTGSLPSGARYLVAEAQGNGGSVALPDPDAEGSISMSSRAGTVALVRSGGQLDCRSTQECSGSQRIADLVGYGDAAVREGEPAPGTSNTSSVARTAEAADTDDNSADFVEGDPTPTNLAGERPGEDPGDDPGDPPGEAIPARVHEIQGDTRVSPLQGKAVRDVTGVVTAVRAFGSSRGYWVQDTAPDSDPATSEGLFVFTGSSTPGVEPGQQVSVAGTVKEYYPLGWSESPEGTANQSITELVDASAEVTGSGELPQPQVLAPGTVPEEYTPTADGGNIEALTLRPKQFALDYYESREGMRLSVSDARVVGATDQYNSLWVTSKPEQNRSQRGGTVYGSYQEQNSGRLKIESLIPFEQRPFPSADVGGRLTGVTAGPLDYTRFGGYVLQASTLGELADGGLTRERAAAADPERLTVASYNVENLDPTDDQAKFDRLAEGLAVNLRGPDVVMLEEVQDNNGATNDSVVAADETLRQFTEAVAAAGGPTYRWRQIDPVDDADGGEPGGNIRVALLFNPDRVSFTDREGGDATTPVRVLSSDGKAQLSASPGRIQPQDPAWQHSRKPLAAEFTFRGEQVIVVVNHFNSKGGDQPLHSRFQPPARSSEQQRMAQAELVRGFVDDVRAADPGAAVVVGGDLNDFPFSDAVRTLTDGDALENTMDSLPPHERYSYVYEGNSQALDQILVSPGVGQYTLDSVHINAEFADQASDHDPQLVGFTPGDDQPEDPESPDGGFLERLLELLRRIFGGWLG